MKWWAHQGKPGFREAQLRAGERPSALHAGWDSPVRVITSEVKWWAHQDLNLGPIDYEDGGEPDEALIIGRIVRTFLDADFRSALVRTYTELRLNVRPIRSQQVEDS